MVHKYVLLALSPLRRFLLPQSPWDVATADRPISSWIIQKPGTVRPNNGSTWDWAALNPCPLNACCDIWGQCGITQEFCTNTTASGG